MMDSAKFKARIDQIYADLDRYSYYELLNLTPEATFDQIQESFHRMALAMHPDRHATNPDSELKKKLHLIYKRVAEGYRVLSNTESRRDYEMSLEKGELRLVRKEKKRIVHREDAIDNPQAKKFYKLGLEAEDKGDLKTAVLHYKFVMDLVGEHPDVKPRFDMLNDILDMKKRTRKTTAEIQKELTSKSILDED